MAVNFCKRKQKWRAELYYKKSRIHVGYFKTQEDANKVFVAGMAEIAKGNIPEKLLLKIKGRFSPVVKSHVVPKEEPVEDAVPQPAKTVVVFYPESRRPIVIESLPVKVEADRYFAKHTEDSSRSKGVSYVSLPRVKWLEGPVI